MSEFKCQQIDSLTVLPRGIVFEEFYPFVNNVQYLIRFPITQILFDIPVDIEQSEKRALSMFRLQFHIVQMSKCTEHCTSYALYGEFTQPTDQCAIRKEQPTICCLPGHSPNLIAFSVQQVVF